MRPDRYAPPRTDVADITPADVALAARPRSVVAAVALIVLSVAIGIVSALPWVDPPMPGEPMAMTAMIWGITLAFAALDAWLLHAIWQRRNWARWAMLALIAVGAAVVVGTFEEEQARAPLVAALALASTLLNLVAAGLLLAAPSAHWFKGAAGR
jgi:hypothetical protein